MDKSNKCRTRGEMRQYAAAILANMGAFCIGTMLGWTSPMQPLLESESPPVGDEPITREVISWLGSVNFIGAICGTLFWGRCSDGLGRRTTGCLVAIPFALSWLIILVAPSANWLIVGRFIVGVGCSGAVINTPIFVTDIAQDDIRGRLGSYLMTFINAGCLFCFVIGSYLSFHAFTAICLAIPITYSALFAWMPESPVYLYGKNKKEAAEQSLMWYRGGDPIQTEKEMARLQNRAVKKNISIKSLWATKGTIKAMFLGFGFVIGQQFCGILAILTYTVMIFQISGSSLSPHSSAIVVGVLQLTSSFASSMLVDKAGRRILLMASYLIMGLCLVTLGWFFLEKDNLDHSLSWIPVTSLSVHVIAYSIGGGPVPFIIMSETFSPEVRGTATSVIQFLGTTLSFISVKTFPALTSLLGTHGCFWFYGGFCALLLCFTVLFVPETKGKTLHSILSKLNGDPEDPAEQEMFTVTSVRPVIVSSKK